MDNSHLPLFSTITAMTKTAKIRHFIFFALLVFALLQRAESVDWKAFEISSGTHFNKKIHLVAVGELFLSILNFFGGRWLGEYRAQDPFNVTFTAQ